MSDSDPGAGNLCNLSFFVPFNKVKRYLYGRLPILRAYD